MRRQMNEIAKRGLWLAVASVVFSLTLSLAAGTSDGGSLRYQDSEEKQETESEPAVEQETKFDAKKMLGEWSFVAGQQGDTRSSPERMQGVVKIDEKAIKMPAGPDATFVMSYKIDAATSPVAVDFKITAGPAPEAMAKGIIGMDGDRLKLIYDPKNETRPSDFKATAANGFHYFELKKATTPVTAKAMEGEWKFVAGVRQGEKLGEERLSAMVTIKDGKFRMPSGQGDDFVMTFKLDTKAEIAAIDMTIVEGPATDISAKGIIKMDGDKMMICYNPEESGDRPEKFESTQDNGFFFFTLQKDSKEKAATEAEKESDDR